MGVCKHLQRGGFMKKSVCGVTKKELSDYTVNNVCDTWRSDYADCVDYKKAKSMCFITTAVCESSGKSDDCHELTSMRAFRDNWLRKQSGGDTEISEYYIIAPQIVEVINALSNAQEIYYNIYEKFIIPCVAFTNNGYDIACHQMYRLMIDTLRQQYIPLAKVY